MRIVQGVFLFAIFVIALAFAVINADPVRLNYYLGSSELPLSLVLIVAFAVGAVMGLAVNLGRILRLRHVISQLRRAARITEQELANLRAIPLRNEH